MPSLHLVLFDILLAAGFGDAGMSCYVIPTEMAILSLPDRQRNRRVKEQKRETDKTQWQRQIHERTRAYMDRHEPT